MASFIDALGVEGAVRFILEYGGADPSTSPRLRDANPLMRMFGRETVEAIARHPVRPRRIPLMKSWLAVYFRAKGQSVPEIARILRVSDITVRNRLRKHGEYLPD